MTRIVLIAASTLAVCINGLGAGSPTAPDIAALLESLHPDYSSYIGSIRLLEHPAPHGPYAGLVRPGGSDPRNPAHGPTWGPGVLNDLVVYPDAFEPSRSAGWPLLIVDHEYFHARHLARGFSTPLPGFGDRGIDRHYHEGLAWAYVLRRADAGIYGELRPRERGEIEARYREHHDAFRAFVMRRQPSAWAHYGRFFLDPARIPTVASEPLLTAIDR